MKGLSCRGEDLRWLGEGSETEREGSEVLGGGELGAKGEGSGGEGGGKQELGTPLSTPT